MTSAFPIPEAVLSNHIAILGKTGSGKSSTGKLMVEHVADGGSRVCILDPIKSDWWGITSSANGKRDGLPFKILGGPHGHVPLHASAGKVIGQLVGQGKLPLSIIDMADFEPGGLQRFFCDFAPALLRSIRGVVYLVIEEAHEFAPKERAGFGAENLAIHWAKKLATAGRSKGLRIVVATQRVQSLHNAVLSSCETVIAHRLTTPDAQKPVIEWLKANADKATVNVVSESLSSLPTGTGWLCSGEAKVFERVAFPKFRTFDNAATPMGNDEAAKVKTAAVDPGELRTLIGEAMAEAEANDPRKLKAEIAKLRADLAKATTVKIVPVAPIVDIETIRTEAHEQGQKNGFLEGYLEGRKSLAQELVSDLQIEAALPALPSDAAHPTASKKTDAPAKTSETPKQDTLFKRITEKARPVKAAPGLVIVPNPLATIGTEIQLSGPQAHLLRGLAWWAAMGHEAPSRTQLAAISGWTPKGSNLRNRLSELSQLGLIVYPRTGAVQLTTPGAAAAPVPDLSTTLLDSIRGILTGPQKQLFEALPCDGGVMDRAALAAAIGWEPGGSNLRNRLSELSQLELVDYPVRGLVALQEWVRA